MRVSAVDLAERLWARHHKTVAACRLLITFHEARGDAQAAAAYRAKLAG